jgi:hypothetical protein
VGSTASLDAVRKKVSLAIAMNPNPDSPIVQLAVEFLCGLKNPDSYFDHKKEMKGI